MREILFRGKRKDSGAWVEGFLVKDTAFYGKPENHAYIVNHEHPSGCFGGDIYIEVKHDTVGQYTGLTDKNGTKIFEGDVLRFYSDYTDEFMGDPCIARYGEFNCTCCEGVYGWYFECGDIRDPNVYGVIGNIHDNPELMEVRNG